MIPGADVVVIGAGSAGCLVAARASDDPARTVLLLESGPAGPLGSDGEIGVLPVGPGAARAVEYPARLMRDRSPTVVRRGTGVGGSGAINGAYFVRAPDADFAAWPATWTARDVAPWFRRIERDLDVSSPRHGDAGPIPVSRVPLHDLAPVSARFLAAAADTGMPYVADMNDGGRDGVGTVPMNAVNGVRVSTSSACLAPVAGRPNLTVRTGVRVDRILFQRNRVHGVVVRDGEAEYVVAAGEVVLCAGAVESPLALTRSGIGEPETLRGSGFPVVTDLPGVGSGLSDHPEVLVPYAADGLRPGTALLEVCGEWHGYEMRPYTAGFDRFIPGSGPGDACVGVSLMASDARGVVRSSGGRAVIEYDYLRSARDRQRLREGAAHAVEILRRAGLGVPPGPVDDTWVRERLATSQHASGTCRMGEAGDPHAVVDPAGKVHGVDGLHVVDGSILPVVPSRGPHATVVMVAARLAESLFGAGA
ncbi:mycofactocin system GMC family oxidoreductase MftG [Rhodococcus rhodnii]|uniref:Choline dehydrogenase n=2 Tax=Rhodococcus rhodnii TaxID=38312 RepID=R7WQB4_9NOCA|nr:choline dehydrogenase [Rhodococcus rhodnii LMG 5362]TXG92548.1 mycofactocin system GMC family oxidoreductase MftG [Rhodococcus rhodnii]